MILAAFVLDWLAAFGLAACRTALAIATIITPNFQLLISLATTLAEGSGTRPGAIVQVEGAATVALSAGSVAFAITTVVALLGAPSGRAFSGTEGRSAGPETNFFGASESIEGCRDGGSHVWGVRSLLVTEEIHMSAHLAHADSMLSCKREDRRRQCRSAHLSGRGLAYLQRQP